jgi:DNA-binding NarL/FixJ family response regulator
VRVVIADDSALLREGLARLLQESGVDVCELTGDAAGLISAVERWHPDVAIIDIRMPPTFTHEGAAAAIQLRETRPDLGILLLSQAVETHYAAQLLERHPDGFGYLLKDRVVDVETLMTALRTVTAGGTVLDPEIVRHLMRHRSGTDVLNSLTERERQVLMLMAGGFSNSAIATRLTVTLKTVESHIANIFSKLGLVEAQDGHRRVLAVLAALRGSADERHDGQP